MTGITFKFTSGNKAKKAQVATLAALKKIIGRGASKPTAAKQVGQGTVLVYMSGTINYYVESSPELGEYLFKQGINL